jgi:uncharacterized protein with HEPN domain
MNNRDRGRLEDMRSFAIDATELLGNRDAKGLEADKRTRYAVIRPVEIVGEAASKVSAEVRAGLPDLPWNDIIGTRHALAHGYDAVVLVRLVDTVRDDLPALIRRLDEVLGDQGE